MANGQQVALVGAEQPERGTEMIRRRRIAPALGWGTSIANSAREGSRPDEKRTPFDSRFNKRLSTLVIWNCSKLAPRIASGGKKLDGL
jgi:hypothetical protein